MDEPADPTRLSQLGHSATEAGRPASQASAAANDIRVSGADLLDRIERQSEELARTQVRVEQLESALDAERKTRRQLGRALADERETATQLEAQAAG